MNKQTFIIFNTSFALLKETRNSFEKSPYDDRKRLLKIKHKYHLKEKGGNRQGLRSEIGEMREREKGRGRQGRRGGRGELTKPALMSLQLD